MLKATSVGNRLPFGYAGQYGGLDISKLREPAPPGGRPKLGLAMADTFFSLLAFCIGLCLWASSLAVAPTASGESQDDMFWKSVLRADVVYVGETHNDAADHRYESELIYALLQRKVQFAIGWEMFDETQQSAIDAWASHSISLNEMLARTDFRRRWGIYSRAYVQILKLAEGAGVRNLALNASPELVHKVAEGRPLSPKERAAMPAGFKTSENAYEYFLTMMGNHPGINEFDMRCYFNAQNVWDQTMATHILQFKMHNPTTRLVVIAGRGHVSGGFGIPSYVRQKANLRQLIIFAD
jgi:uncharacterized iron-regulated protein